MRIEVLYFASAREAAGVPAEGLDVPEAATVADLEGVVGALHPGLRAGWKTLRFAVGGQFSPVTHRLQDGDRVALLPPVSGG
jgi:molybdopterin converting factor subunit 1